MAGKHQILIIDSDRAVVEALSALFRSKGFSPFGVYTGKKGLELALNDTFNLIILDMNLPDISSLELVKRIRGLKVLAPVIMIAEANLRQAAIEATTYGAFSFVEKPVNDENLWHLTDRALMQLRLQQDLERLRQTLADRYQIVGHSRLMVQLRDKLKRIALSSSRLLLTGEPGSGKRTAAQYIHYTSERATAPLAIVNCAFARAEKADRAFNFECELFGFDKGAFVGATQSTPGQFELADGGTMYFANVDALTAEIQAKMLRVIESGAVQRIGSNQEIKTDVRILAGADSDLESEVKTGRFREDLYFRLNVIPAAIPPLRAHPEDIPLLISYHLDRVGYVSKTIEKQALEYLKAETWPGNIRELNEIIEAAAAATPGATIKLEYIKNARAVIQSRTAGGGGRAQGRLAKSPAESALFIPNLSFRRQVTEFEKKLLTEVLEQAGGNITKAAEMLKTDRGNLSKKIKKLGVKIGKPGS